LKRIKPKKYLGQHFLKDSNISKKIVESLISKKLKSILEIGPGMGILTQYLINKKPETFFIEIDKDSIMYLDKMYPKIIITYTGFEKI
jgi:16S rRNA (adenine1518-N6/adenine1519-N6)-dimethyltransferase